MSVTYYKGFVGKEDIEFGTGTFTRKDKNHASRDLTQVHCGHIPRKVIAKTADFTITGDYIGEYTFTNEGASGSIIFTLPSAKSGLGIYNFIITDLKIMRILPVGTDYFRDSEAGFYKWTIYTGSRLKVWCDIDGIWEWDYDVEEGYWVDTSI